MHSNAGKKKKKWGTKKKDSRLNKQDSCMVGIFLEAS